MSSIAAKQNSFWLVSHSFRVLDKSYQSLYFLESPVKKRNDSITIALFVTDPVLVHTLSHGNRAPDSYLR